MKVNLSTLFFLYGMVFSTCTGAVQSSSSAASGLNMLVWPNTAYAPPDAATVTQVSVINFTSTSNFVPSYTSVRFTGTIMTTVDDLITFTAVTDGGVRLWIDDHLTIDDGNTHSSRSSVAFLNIPFIAGTPQPFRLEYTHFDSTVLSPSLQLNWQGNVTVAGIVPTTAFTPIVANAEVLRTQLRDRLINPACAWQTYNNPTMGSHVHMPSGFIVDATLADTQTNSILGDIIVFRRSNPAVTMVGGHSKNGSDYTELHISQWRSRQCDIVFQTTVVNNGQDIQFLATSNGTDCAHMVLLLQPSMLAERYGAFMVGSDSNSIMATLPGFDSIVIHAIGASSVPFNANVSVSLALPLDAMGNGNSVVGYYSGSPVTIDTMESNIATAKAIQAMDKVSYGELADAYDALSSIILWNTMFTPIEGVITPVSRGWDFGSGYVLFDWDNYFLSYMASLENGTLKDISYVNLIQITQSRTLTGFVPNFVSGTRASYDRTEPQIGAYVTLQIYNKWGEAWIIDLLIDSLKSWNDWVWNRRRGEGIYAGSDGYANLIVLGSDPTSPSGDGSTNTFQGARLESGLDNSPQYQYYNDTDVPFNSTTHHMEFYDIGMTGLYLSDTWALIQLAEIAGRYDMIPELQQRYDAVNISMNMYLWDNTNGMYSNAFFDGTLHPRYAPTSYFPLISGSATDEQAAAMMNTFTSPLGFCFNTSYTPDPNAAMLVQWYDGHDNAALMTDASMAEIVIAEYNFIRVEANAILPSGSVAPPGNTLVPLYSYYSSITGDHALTTNSSGPDNTYTLIRQEGWCYSTPPTSGWPTTLLSLFYSASRKDYQTCGSPGCRVDTGPNSSYVFVSDLCYAYNGTGPTNLPCKYGGPSIARGDPNFYDNDYWRGRIWGPHYQLMYWALRTYDHVPQVRAARLELVTMGKSLVEQNWNLFRQVAENVNGIIGVAEDVGSADPFYHWGALFGFVSFLENGVY